MKYNMLSGFACFAREQNFSNNLVTKTVFALFGFTGKKVRSRCVLLTWIFFLLLSLANTYSGNNNLKI